MASPRNNNDPQQTNQVSPTEPTSPTSTLIIENDEVPRQQPQPVSNEPPPERKLDTENSWTCPCNHWNGELNLRCVQCNSHRYGLWRCDCGILNLPTSSICKECRSSRWAQGVINHDAVESEPRWYCRCGLSNSPLMARCFNCHETKSQMNLDEDPVQRLTRIGDSNVDNDNNNDDGVRNENEIDMKNADIIEDNDLSPHRHRNQRPRPPLQPLTQNLRGTFTRSFLAMDEIIPTINRQIQQGPARNENNRDYDNDNHDDDKYHRFNHLRLTNPDFVPYKNGWNCECSCNNHPNSMLCGYCRGPKPVPIQSNNNQMNSRSITYQNGWDCTCGASNHPNSQVCVICKYTKQERERHFNNNNNNNNDNNDNNDVRLPRNGWNFQTPPDNTGFWNPDPNQIQPNSSNVVRRLTFDTPSYNNDSNYNINQGQRRRQPQVAAARPPQQPPLPAPANLHPPAASIAPASFGVPNRSPPDLSPIALAKSENEALQFHNRDLTVNLRNTQLSEKALATSTMMLFDLHKEALSAKKVKQERDLLRYENKELKNEIQVLKKINIEQEAKIVCPICVTNVKNRLLNCSHTICSNCCEKIRIHSLVPTCPFCRTQIDYNQIRVVTL